MKYCFGAREGGKYKENHYQNCMRTGISQTTEKNDKERCRGIVKRCTLIREETREVQENRLESFKKKGYQQLTMDSRKAQIKLLWFCWPGQRCLSTKSTVLKMQS